MSASIGVAVASRNRCDRLVRLLDSLERQSCNDGSLPVAVVDDASTDGTWELLQRRRGEPGLRLSIARNARRRGPAIARNRAWHMLSAEIVAFTDDDCEPVPDWLAQLVATGSEMVQGSIEPNPYELDRISPFSRTLSADRLGPWFQTANMLYSRDLLERLGGFDERFPNPGGEDTDLALRAIEVGVRPQFAPEAVVHHEVADLGVSGKLAVAARWGPAMAIFGRHPQLRSELFLGVFWKRSHARLPLALIGIAMARRSPAWLLLCGPYARQLRRRMRAERAEARHLGFYPLHDAVELAATLHGAVRTRTFVI